MNEPCSENRYGNIVIYQSEDGLSHMDVHMENDTVWLTQAQLVELYRTSKSNISEHIKHIFADGEPTENSVVRNIRTTAADGKAYHPEYYHYRTKRTPHPLPLACFQDNRPHMIKMANLFNPPA